MSRSCPKHLVGKKYVYIWRTPEGVAFYVGCGSHGRAWDYRPSGRGRLCAAALQHIKKRGAKVAVEITAFGTKDEMSTVERDLVAKFGCIELGTGTLTNLTPGGLHDFKATTDHCDRIAASLRGVKHTPQRRANISKALAGRTYKRPPHSEATKQKQRAAALRRYARERGEC